MHHIPNIISILRMFLVLPIAIQLYHGNWMFAFVLIFIAGLSDALDGFLARAFNWQSNLGSFLDPIADKLLLIVIFVLLAHKNIIPIWLMGLVVGRDIVIVAGASFYQWKTRALKMSPLISSKINTAMQVIFVLCMLIHLTVMPLPSLLIQGLVWVVALTTVVSGALYVINWTYYYNNHLSQSANNS